MASVWLVCDTSGSMIEGGKRLILRGLVRQLEQYLRLGYAPKRDLKLVAWNDEAAVQPWSPSDEAPHELFDCSGSADGNALVRLVGTPTDDKVLLLTDGFWPDESRATIKRWKDAMAPGALRVIKVGADANPRLTGSDVFEVEDFWSAMEGWLDK